MAILQTFLYMIHICIIFGKNENSMPNLKPPVTTTALATDYYNQIMKSLPSKDIDFQPLMTLYLTDNTTPEEIKKAKETGFI